MPVPTGGHEVARRSLRDAAVDRLRTAIFDGTLTPGEHLNDHELQDWLGMSRTPIREALNDLARVGLIEMVAQRFTRVALPDPRKRTEVLQTIGAMFGGIVRLTVPALSIEQRGALLEALDSMLAELPQRDPSKTTPAGWVFIDQVLAMCPNQTLLTATKDIVDALTFQMMSTADVEVVRWDLLEEGYAQLHAALLSEDAVAAELAIEHIFRLSEVGA